MISNACFYGNSGPECIHYRVSEILLHFLLYTSYSLLCVPYLHHNLTLSIFVSLVFYVLPKKKQQKHNES